MTVFIPGPLRSYTRDQSCVQASGGTLAELLWELDRRYPGIRFRMVDEQHSIRQHIKIFVNQEKAAALGVGLGPEDEVHIICAISGGSRARD